VTGIAPKAVLRGRLLVRDFIMNSFLAVVVTLLFGLSFPWFGDPSPSNGSADVNAALGGAYVLLVVWLARALMFAPYWRARDSAGAPPKHSPHQP